ncbi:lytic transglycosylase domain-containing protein [Vibrio algicola]|uniref:lytic transglycosylase domain-containing protein n=1 Tax=Vibrio algicola TaxID=2662262 RepID=UPI0015B7218D|nr:lytic transglycosylase domain-containing protein [Vibrio algicola]
MKVFLILCLCIISPNLYAQPHDDFQSNASFQSTSSSWHSQYVQSINAPDLPPYYSIVERYAGHYGVPRALIFAMIETESNFNPHANSSAGAKGLMQLMDFHSKHWHINPYNPDDNIKIGTYLIAKLLRKYHHSLPLALAAYNAGDGAVHKYHGVPPYQETQNYITRIIKKMRRYQ